MFNKLRDAITQETDPRLVELVDYVDTNWIQSTVWPAAAWTVHRETIRTNNDIEGKHRQ